MRKLSSVVVVGVLAFGGFACKSAKKSSAPTPTQAVEETNKDEKKDTGAERRSRELLATQMDRIIEVKCLSCHQGESAQAGLDFTNEDVIVASSEIIASMILDKTLPAFDELSAEEVEIVRAWKDAGYPRPPIAAPELPDDNKDKPNQNDKTKNPDKSKQTIRELIRERIQERIKHRLGCFFRDKHPHDKYPSKEDPKKGK